MGGSSLVIGVLDYAYQRFEWERGLRMSREEIKEESRAAEGDPVLRGKIRSMQKDMARRRMMAAVPKADVIITNPTHLAVALRYDPKAMGAPIVVAKGAGFVAEKIREIGRQHGVMIVENKLVARTLFKLVDVGREVPEDLYRAVAEILAFVYRVRGKLPPA
jgi:flagellar biosynthetic protein FlhB